VSKSLIYRLIWIPSAVALMVVFALFSRPGVTEAAPAAMTAYAMSDKSMQMQHPANWQASESSQHGVGASVKFVVDDYSGIRFSTDLAGSLQADIDRANSIMMSNPDNSSADNPNPEANPAPRPPDKSPLQKAHERKGQELEQSKEFENYQEGETRSVRIAGQEALMTDFTYTEHGAMGDKPEAGVRATALLGESRLLILAHCTKEKAKQLMPIFQQMIDSLQVSPTGGQQ
jgi:hypothetical protein